MTRPAGQSRRFPGTFLSRETSGTVLACPMPIPAATAVDDIAKDLKELFSDPKWENEKEKAFKSMKILVANYLPNMSAVDAITKMAEEFQESKFFVLYT